MAPPVPAALDVALDPSLPALAEAIHEAVAGLDAPALSFVEHDAHGTVRLGLWPVPDVPLHPIEPLVGFRAPASWHALGLTSPARLQRLDGETPPEAATATLLLAADGSAASILGTGADAVQVLDDLPVGFVPDVLARCLGLATPPPTRSIATFVDLTWLDRLAASVLGEPGGPWSWRRLADRHPLRGTGPVPAPEDLAARAVAYAGRHPWPVLLERNATLRLPAADWGPPDGSTEPAGTWFDPGSFARWTLRLLPPAEAILPDVLALLPPDLGDLITVALAEEADGWP